MPYKELISMIQKIISSSSTRVEASRDLARILGAKDLIFFMKDPIIGIFLPAPGFPQTLPDGRKWRQFLFDCQCRGRKGPALLTCPFEQKEREIKGFKLNESLILVLIGVNSRIQYDFSPEIMNLFSILASHFKNERIAQNAEAQMAFAKEINLKAKNLNLALDKARSNLQEAQNKAENREARLLELVKENSNLQFEKEELGVLVQLLIQNAPIAMGWLERNLQFTDVNQSWLDFFNTPVSVYLEQTPSSIFPKFGVEIEKVAKSALYSDSVSVSWELRTEIQHPRALQQSFLLAAYPLKLKNNQRGGVGLVAMGVQDSCSKASFDPLNSKLSTLSMSAKSHSQASVLRSIAYLFSQHAAIPGDGRFATDRFISRVNGIHQMMSQLLGIKN